MKEQIKELRTEIDRLAQLCEGLNPIVIHGVDVISARSLGHDGTETDCTEIGFTERKGNSEEIKEAVKSLKLSKAWLGKVLEQLGSKNPYGSGYKTVEDIEPTADKATEIIIKQNLYNSLISEGEIKQSWNEKSHIEKVDWLRTEIKRLLDKLRKPTMPIDVSTTKRDFNVEKYLEDMDKHSVMLLEPFVQGKSGDMDKATQYLQEARFWLGFELGRVRDKSKK